MKYIKTFVFFGPFNKWEISNEIEYKSYLIPVYKKNSEEMLGHPRPKGEKIPYMPELIVYNKSKLDGLKKAIDVMVEKGNSADWKDYQSGLEGMNQSGTPVPSIFPKDDGKIDNPTFKGYAG